MSGPGPQDVTSLLAAGSRRAIVRAIAYAGAFTAAEIVTRPGVARAQDSSPEAVAGLPALTGTTYIGATSDPNAFIAVIVAADGETARAYLCNAADVVEWFDEGGVTGEGEGQIDLRSAAGAHLTGEVTAELVGGEVDLPDGRALTFEASLATGVDGLYTFTVGTDGRAEGTSSTGALIEGELFLSGTITLPDGETAPYQWPVQIDDVSELRTIYREAGGRRGEGKTRKGTKMVIQP